MKPAKVGVVIMESDTSVRPIIKPGRTHNPVVTTRRIR